MVCVLLCAILHMFCSLLWSSGIFSASDYYKVMFLRSSTYPVLAYSYLVDHNPGVVSRFLESHWFVWVTQMSHIPMDIDYEKHDDWLSMQVHVWLCI